ncbi:MAG: acyl-CoA dehydratase activase [Smithellaceae bacterium]
MITCGIDIGVYSTKLVILDGNKIFTSRIARTGNRVGAVVKNLFKKTLRELSLNALDCVVATGIGRKKAAFAKEWIPEIVADACGAVWLYPSARTVIDVGAEEVRVIKCSGNGDVLNYVRNNRCAAGAGVFLESMSRILEVPLGELGDLALTSQNEVHISSTCVVFSESEVVSLVHSNVAKADIARAVSESIASKISSIVNSIGPESDVIFIGGVAGNKSVVNELIKATGLSIQKPSQPQIAGAIGAALIAQKLKN